MEALKRPRPIVFEDGEYGRLSPGRSAHAVREYERGRPSAPQSMIATQAPQQGRDREKYQGIEFDKPALFVAGIDRDKLPDLLRPARLRR